MKNPINDSDEIINKILLSNQLCFKDLPNYFLYSDYFLAKCQEKER